jgi:hypothetical protein
MYLSAKRKRQPGTSYARDEHGSLRVSGLTCESDEDGNVLLVLTCDTVAVNRAFESTHIYLSATAAEQIGKALIATVETGTEVTAEVTPLSKIPLEGTKWHR